MNLKATIKLVLGAIGQTPIISAIIERKSVRKWLAKIPGLRLLYPSGWDRIHPFDRFHGTDTSGTATTKHLPVSAAIRDHAIDYAGSQPNVLRLALAKLPKLNSFTFLDLGCGKGRALLVASEFPFRDILGVELSSKLAQTTIRNAKIVSSRFPNRTAVRVSVGDASTYPLPAGDLVIFLYNPFSATLVANVVAGIEAALANEDRSIYVIYYNPIAGHCFDASSQLHRCFAKMLPYADQELGYGPDAEDPVVIWQGGTASIPMDVTANAKIVVNHAARVIIEFPHPVFS
jgi:SAM-dependent methyltransferase